MYYCFFSQVSSCQLLSSLIICWLRLSDIVCNMLARKQSCNFLSWKWHIIECCIVIRLWYFAAGPTDGLGRRRCLGVDKARLSSVVYSTSRSRRAQWKHQQMRHNVTYRLVNFCQQEIKSSDWLWWFFTLRRQAGLDPPAVPRPQPRAPPGRRHRAVRQQDAR